MNYRDMTVPCAVLGCPNKNDIARNQSGKPKCILCEERESKTLLKTTE